MTKEDGKLKQLRTAFVDFFNEMTDLQKILILLSGAGTIYSKKMRGFQDKIPSSDWGNAKESSVLKCREDVE